MRIITLHIYGFGRFQDVSIDLHSAEFQVIYGQNEAGKSTLLAFVEAILFGFPTKQRNERTFEPKTGSAYGGKLTIATSEYGVIMIERTKGKATGNVIVYFDNGTTAGEPFLETLLGGIDRKLFRGIFSFGLTDLQGVEQVTSAELGKYLYGVGMNGKHSITEYEKKLAKQQDELFKPQGKKPELNQKLAIITQLEEKMVNWKKKLQDYENLYTTKNVLEHSLHDLEKMKRSLSEEKRIIEKGLLIEPLLVDKKYMDLRWAEVEHVQFPIERLHQVEALQLSIQNLNENQLEQQVKLQRYKEKLTTTMVDESLLKEEGTLKQLFKKVPHYAFFREESTRLQLEIEEVQARLYLLYEQLGPDWNKEKVIQAETSYRAKEELQLLLLEKGNLSQRLSYLSNEMEKKRLILEEAELQLNTMKQKVLSKQEKERLEEKLKAERLKKEEPYTFSLLELQLDSVQKEHPLFMLFFLLVIGITSGLIGMLRNEWLLALTIFFITAIVIGVRFYQQHRKGINIRRKIVELKQKIEADKREEELNDYTNINLILQREKELQQQIEIQQVRVSQEEKAYLHIVEELEQNEINSQRCVELLQEWGRQYATEIPPNFKGINELLSIIEKAKEQLYELAKYQEIRKETEGKMNAIRQEVQKYAPLFKIDYTTVEMTSQTMEFLLQEEINKQQSAHYLQEQITKQEEELLVLQHKIAFYQGEIQQLYSDSEVETEEAFHQLAKAAKEKDKLHSERNYIAAQLQAITKDERELQHILNLMENSSIPLVEMLEKIESEGRRIADEEKQKRMELASLLQQMKQLEDGQSYSELMQKFELEKQALTDLARKWAVLRTSEFLIEKAKEIYENERQPIVMQKAAKYFLQMTEGEYVKLFAPVGEETFVVERKDGIRFYPEELSQGTTEQLYLSLRFALATSVKSPFAFPILMDDILVNFDDNRKRAAAQMIKNLANERQIIMFSCHSYIVDLFEGESTKQLSEAIENRL